jgi:hypothetical protein
MWWCGFLLMAFLLCGGVLWQVILPAWDASNRISCIGTLKILGVIVHNYENQHGHFPPAHLLDKDGRPMHSWRILLLEFEQPPQLYEEYSFDEPWNSPNNLALAHNVPSGMVAFSSTYRCPSDSEADELHATYLMPVGPGTFSDGPNGRKVDQFTDGTSNTLMVVERSQSGIHWMEPRDLDVAKMSYRINDPAGYGIRSTHPAGASALFADGTVSSISKDVDPEILRAIITIDAGDPGSEFHSRYH